MAEFTRKTDANGVVRYRNVTENKQVSAEELEKNFPALKEELDLADEGTRVESEGMTGDTSSTTDSDGNRSDEDKDSETDGTETRNGENAEATGNQESDQDNKDSEETNPYRRSVPASEPGMGDFKRVKGKTVDIFDQKTPHTDVRYVGGLMVPLSKKNYESKSDAEIYERLEELKLV